MILLDFSQIIISNLMQSLNEIDEINEDFLRHMILNSLRYYNKRFRKKYGDLVICCDVENGMYWRKEIFPHYKYHRKKHKEESELDWDMIFISLNKIKNEIRDFLPYKVIEVNRSEADDIIGVLTKYKHGEECILIVSGDKDFKQLQRYRNVKQYAPVQKEMMNENDPISYIKEHIMRGDKGDGIPNFLSSEKSFVDGIRQKSIMSKKIDVWMNQKPELFCDDVMLKRYKTNQKLIDLTFIPEDIQLDILNVYDNIKTGNTLTMRRYFIKNRLRYLFERIGEF